MFQLTKIEYESLKCQIGTSNKGRGGKQKYPLVFTENGVAMLSSVLRSEEAALVNISIMGIFTKLRSFHLLEDKFQAQVNEVKANTNRIFKIVFERLDDLEGARPNLDIKRRKISLK